MNHRRSFLAALGAMVTVRAFGQTAPVPTVGIMSGELNGTFVRIADDLKSVVDKTKLRLLPVFGLGSVQNISDLINVPGVDLALVAADALPYVKAHGTLPRQQMAAIQYVCKLYDNDLHVLAGPDIRTLADLDGKPVNADVVGSGTDLTARAVFTAMGVNPLFRNADPDTGMVDLREGRVAANVYCVGKPARLFTSLSAGSGLHFVPIEANDDVLKVYIPGTFSHEDYPALVPEGQEVPNVGVGVALANFGWAANTMRYRNLTAFVDGFFSNFATLLQPPHHPAWHQVNLAATLPGWTRFQPAVDWLTRRSEQASFIQYLQTQNVQVSPDRVETLFRGFKQWEAAHVR